MAEMGIEDAPDSVASNVVPLVPPLSRARATEIVRDAVAAGRYSITMMHSADSFPPAVLSRQIDRVLRDGQILEETVEYDGKGYYQFRMLRVCAGMSVEIDVALEAMKTIPHLFVTRVRGDDDI